jgi:hypothetical protein
LDFTGTAEVKKLKIGKEVWEGKMKNLALNLVELCANAKLRKGGREL